MAFLANRDINRLAAHSAVHQLAASVSGVFFSAFLLRAQVAPAGIFLCVAGIFVLRFMLRPLVRFAIRGIGLRRTLVLGTLLFGLQYPVLASVRGIGPELLLYAVAAALADVFYWPCYHILFSALGDVEHRGSQLGASQALGTIVAMLGPAAGGITLATFGPWAAFGAAALIEWAATLPLLKVSEPRIAPARPNGAYASAKTGVLLIFTNGWISGCSAIAWDIIAFRALSERYEMFGGALSAAALAGALGGVILGRLIDAGHASRAVWINATACAGVFVLKALCGADPAFVVAVAIVASILGGLYAPSLVTAFYNEAKSSPDHLRFQFAAEAGFDAGGFLACLGAAVACASGVPLQAVVLMALPAVALQARLLNRHYAACVRGVSAEGGAAIEETSHRENAQLVSTVRPKYCP